MNLYNENRCVGVCVNVFPSHWNIRFIFRDKIRFFLIKHSWDFLFRVYFLYVLQFVCQKAPSELTSTIPRVTVVINQARSYVNRTAPVAISEK